MNDRPSCSPMSWMVQMLGWFNADAVRASRRKRLSASGSPARSWRQELQRDGRLQPRVLGFVDDAHAAAAELFDDAVVRQRLTDQSIGIGLGAVVAVVTAVGSGELTCGHVDGRSAQKAAGAVVCGEQRADFLLDLRVAGARVPHEGVALRRGAIERRLQQLIDERPAFAVHSRFFYTVRTRNLSRQPRVFGAGFPDHRNVLVGILPQREEIVIGAFRLRVVARERERSRQLQARQGVHGIDEDDAAMIENPLELGDGFGGLTGGEVRQAANVDGVQARRSVR